MLFQMAERSRYANLLITSNYFEAGESEVRGDLSTVSEREDLGLPLLELSTLAHATGNFSVDNQLGEGGFGPVYKVLILR